jgi:hypothetical protein
MKVLSILLVALFSAFVISCCQQKVEAPEKVLTSFEKMFPAATDVEWEMENENEWEAEFDMDGKEVSACFTSVGEWIETEYKVETLPETIETIVNETYPGFEIDEIEIVESPEFKGYEIEMEKGEEELEIKVTHQGEIIEVEISEKEDEEIEED